MLASPMSEIATAPRAEVEDTPMLSSMEPETMGLHISVTKAGKCAVTNASW